MFAIDSEGKRSITLDWDPVVFPRHVTGCLLSTKRESFEIYGDLVFLAFILRHKLQIDLKRRMKFSTVRLIVVKSGSMDWKVRGKCKKCGEKARKKREMTVWENHLEVICKIDCNICIICSCVNDSTFSDCTTKKRSFSSE